MTTLRIALIWAALAVTLILATGPAAALPTVDAVAATAGGDDTVSILTNGPVDVRSLLQSLADKAGLGLRMGPEVQGEVDIHLENVSLDYALREVTGPLGLACERQGRVLAVGRGGMITRWFSLNYPVTEREGRGELQVSGGGNSASSGGSSGSSGSSGSENENKSQISSTLIMSIWPEVMQALTTLVFREAADLQTQTQNARAVNLADGSGRVLVANPMASLIQVTAESERVDAVASFVERLNESLQRQVAVQVRILEVSLDEQRETGINWSILASNDVEPSLQSVDREAHVGSEYFQFIVDNADITGVLEAIETNGDMRTVATPRVTTLNNQKAVVRIVTEDVFYLAEVEPGIVTNGVATEPVVNYTPQTIPVGVVLDVTPQVGADGVITMNVHPTISDVVGIAESPNRDTAPILSVRELDTVGKVRDGETLVLAGLISERTRAERSGIPVLKDLPLLGYVFGKTSHERYNIELVIMLTPVVLQVDGASPWPDLDGVLELSDAVSR